MLTTWQDYYPSDCWDASAACPIKDCGLVLPNRSHNATLVIGEDNQQSKG